MKNDLSSRVLRGAILDIITFASITGLWQWLTSKIAGITSQMSLDIATEADIARQQVLQEQFLTYLTVWQAIVLALIAIIYLGSRMGVWRIAAQHPQKGWLTRMLWVIPVEAAFLLLGYVLLVTTSVWWLLPLLILKFHVAVAVYGGALQGGRKMLPDRRLWKAYGIIAAMFLCWYGIDYLVGYVADYRFQLVISGTLLALAMSGARALALQASAPGGRQHA